MTSFYIEISVQSQVCRKVAGNNSGVIVQMVQQSNVLLATQDDRLRELATYKT